MRKALLVLSVVLLAGAPLCAQEFFGITPEDGQAMIAQAKAQAHLARLRGLGWEGDGTLAGARRMIGMTLTSASRQDCVLDAVIAKTGARLPYDTVYPDVLRESETNEDAYRAAVRSAAKAEPKDFQTVYLPVYNVIYLADSSSAYPSGAAMDAALAGAYAGFLDAQAGITDAARVKADEAAAAAWYASAYPDGATSCR
jgi:hypothetical protein